MKPSKGRTHMTTKVLKKKSLKAVDNALTTVTKQFDKMPSRMKDAQKTLNGVQASGVKMVKKYPLRTALGAFAAGVAITKIARYV